MYARIKGDRSGDLRMGYFYWLCTNSASYEGYVDCMAGRDIPRASVKVHFDDGLDVLHATRRVPVP